MPLRERLVDFAIPQRKFKAELNKEIRNCLDYFENPSLIKGIGITVGRTGEEGRTHALLDRVRGVPRGYFWEKGGSRHIVGQEVMTKKQKDELVSLIHHVTIPYADFTGRLPAKFGGGTSEK